MIPTHLMYQGRTACGIDPFDAGELRSTQHKAIVSCEACMATVAYGQARQRFPAMPPAPRYEPVAKVR